MSIALTLRRNLTPILVVAVVVVGAVVDLKTTVVSVAVLFIAFLAFCIIRLGHILFVELTASIPPLPLDVWPTFENLVQRGFNKEQQDYLERIADKLQNNPKLLEQYGVDASNRDEMKDFAVAITYRDLAIGGSAIWAIPLSDFARFAEAPSPKDFNGKFALAFPVGYDLRLTKPVGSEHQRELGPFGRVEPLFVTDFASIPGFIQRIVGPPVGSYSRAAVVHDWAYANHKPRSARGAKRV